MVVSMPNEVLFLMAKNGNQKALIELWKAVEKMFIQLVPKNKYSFWDFDDWMSHAKLVFFKKWRSYKIEKACFNTFIFLVVRRSFLTRIKRQQMEYRKISVVEDPMTIQELQFIEGVFKSQESDYLLECFDEFRRELDKKVEKFTIQIFESYILNGIMNVKAISEKYGVRSELIYQHLRIVKKLLTEFLQRKRSYQYACGA